MQLINGDCLEAMAALPDSSVDAIVTDPPYGLSFMGKAWDYDVPKVEIWREAFRVLKPGGHLLAFFGSRTYHRGAVQIEDGGFEIRDQIMWIYGSGFPKSLDISKAIDKRGGVAADFSEFRDDVKAAMVRANISRAQLQAALGNFMLSHYLTAGSQPAIPNWRDYQIIRDTVGLCDKWDDLFAPQAKREVVGKAQWSNSANHFVPGEDHTARVQLDITAPATDAARKWQGWGTALKPSHEPIVMARKPLIGTVAANVMEHGTGAINVDGCRVGDGTDKGVWPITKRRHADVAYTLPPIETDTTVGRWPANVIHDGSDEPTRLFGSAARFFYCAKANKADRGEGNSHPTVKPTDLMRYLCRLVTPPGGVVLDPFMGSGSTGKAALLEGFDFIGIERDPNYYEIAQQRIAGIQPQLQLVAGNFRDPELADLGEVV